jgi:hypothetical protein
MALAQRLDAISQGPKKSRFPGSNPLPLALVMDVDRIKSTGGRINHWSINSYYPPMQSGTMNWASCWIITELYRMTIPRMNRLGKSEGSLAGVDRCGIETSYANIDYL